MTSALRIVTAVILTGAVLAGMLATGAPGARAEDLADPTAPPRPRAAKPEPTAGEAPVAEVAAPEPKVSAIWAVGNRRYALLDMNTRVQVGDSVGERKVVRITDNTVTLRGAEGEKVLSMFPEIEKTVRNTNANVKPTPPVRTASKTENSK